MFPMSPLVDASRDGSADGSVAGAVRLLSQELLPDTALDAGIRVVIGHDPEAPELRAPEPGPVVARAVPDGPGTVRLIGPNMVEPGIVHIIGGA